MLQKKEQLELERQILNKTDLLIETAIETSMMVGEDRDRKLENSIQIVCEMASLLQEYLGGHPEHFETLLKELTKQKLPDENILSSFGEFNALLDTAIKKGLERYWNEDQELPVAAPVQEPLQVVEEAEVSLKAPEEETLEVTASKDDDNTENFHAVMEEEPLTEEEQLAAPEEIDKTGVGEQLPEDSSEPAKEYTVEPSEPEIAQPDGNQDSWNMALRHLFPGATISKDYSFKGLTFSYFLPEKAIAIDIDPKNRRETIWKEYYCRTEKIRLLSLPPIKNARPRQIVRTLKQSLAQNAGQHFS